MKREGSGFSDTVEANVFQSAVFFSLHRLEFLFLGVSFGFVDDFRVQYPSLRKETALIPHEKAVVGRFHVDIHINPHL